MIKQLDGYRVQRRVKVRHALKTPRCVRHFVANRISLSSHTWSLWLDLRALHHLIVYKVCTQVQPILPPTPTPTSIAQSTTHERPMRESFDHHPSLPRACLARNSAGNAVRPGSGTVRGWQSFNQFISNFSASRSLSLHVHHRPSSRMLHSWPEQEARQSRMCTTPIIVTSQMM